MRRLMLVISILLIIFGVGYWVLKTESSDPHVAIKKYVFRSGSFLEAFDLDIASTSTIDQQYGQQFVVNGFFDNATGMEVHFFYLKQNTGGWYVTSAGTGP